MDALRWQRLNDLYHGALGCAVGERRAWLERACAGDAALAAEVERLVRAHERASSFIRTDDSPVQRIAAHDRAIRREFVGTERYAVRRTLGVGGMGVVYEVHDRARDEIVALKTLLRAGPTEILRLKREFRSLADVAHVNLVSLYELFADGDQCFFTMELVNGVTFVDAVRLPGASGDRLRLLLPQLVEGVSELHRLGKLHRDLKPSNVLVTLDGRVVILDFGLIEDMGARIAGMGDRVAGTPSYMSPEQALGVPASEADDWYGVGVTLYEALTGQLPFPGTLSQTLEARTERDPPPPSAIAPDVPEDLSAICMNLIHRDPARRVSGVDAIRQFAGCAPATGAARARVGSAPFVGRERQLAVLRESLQAARDGRTAAVHVCGPSGIGKSALVRSFLDRLLARDEALVLRGRCYENESIPYKALDGVVDSLSQYLATRSPASLASVPRDLTALARLFPVMQRVVGSEPAQETDPVLLRRRAFGALRELFARIARIRPLVLFIDDLHWADADSVLLLEELLRPPDPPPLLLLSCFRTEEMTAKPFLRTLLDGGAVPLPLAPLTDAEARELIAAGQPGGSAVNPDDATRIVKEAEGNPFLLEQMVHYVALPRADGRRGPTLDEMLEERLHGLPAGAREFLTTLAICGRPMTASLVAEASGLTGDERPVVTKLRATNFVRTSGALERVEIYHDRIRESVAARLDAEALRRVHRRVADTLTARQIDDPEALFEHCRGAGDDKRAQTHAAAAARKASAALAFDRAATFYRHALELVPGAAHLDWKEGLATALANAGRPADAAAVYQEAASDARGAERLELQRRSAEQYLTGGHLDRGVEVVRAVLAAAGMRFPRGPRQALASLLVRRAQLRWRGLKFREREAGEVPPEVLLRIDTCWSVMTGLAMADNVRSWDFESRHLLAALEAGEPYRVARGFAAEAAFYASRGGAARRYVARLAAMAAELSARVGNPHAIAFATFTEGMAAVLGGEWTRASLLCERALTLFRDTCVGVTWELSGAQHFLLGALLYQGELQDVARRLPGALATAKDRGNLYLEAELRTRMMTLVLLAADEPGEADRQAQEVMQRWWRGGFTRQHYNHVLGSATTALYRGDGQTAWKVVEENRAALKRTLLLQVQLLRIEMSFLRGRCALAAASGNRLDAAVRRRFLSSAKREGRRLAREKMSWSDGFALLLNAAIAAQTGDRGTAEQRLATAVDTFDRADMKLYAAGARRRLGLIQGERGRPLVRDAEAWMASQAIRNPRSMTRLIAPGFPDA